MRTERCTKCRVEKPVNDMVRDRHSTTGYSCWCKACKTLARDLHERPKRLAEINRIEELLTRDRCDLDRMALPNRYQPFRRTALADPNFEFNEGEDLVVARLRWLKQRTAETL